MSIARRAREEKGGLEPEQVGVGHERARGVKYREEGEAMEGRNMVTMAVASGIAVPTSGITKLEPNATPRGKVTIGDEGG